MHFHGEMTYCQDCQKRTYHYEVEITLQDRQIIYGVECSQCGLTTTKA